MILIRNTGAQGVVGLLCCKQINARSISACLMFIRLSD